MQFLLFVWCLGLAREKMSKSNFNDNIQNVSFFYAQATILKLARLLTNLIS